MAHNQYQFQQVLSKEGIRLRQCDCSPYHFPVVEYTKGKTIRIYCQFGCGCVTLNKGTMTEDKFIKTAAVNWNTGRWDK